VRRSQGAQKRKDKTIPPQLSDFFRDIKKDGSKSSQHSLRNMKSKQTILSLDITPAAKSPVSIEKLVNIAKVEKSCIPKRTNLVMNLLQQRKDQPV